MGFKAMFAIDVMSPAKYFEYPYIAFYRDCLSSGI